MYQEIAGLHREAVFSTRVEAAIYDAQIFTGAVLAEASLLYTSNSGDKFGRKGILHWESYLDDVSRGRCTRASAIAVRWLQDERSELFRQGFILAGEPIFNPTKARFEFNGIPWRFHTMAIIEDVIGGWWALSPANTGKGKEIFTQKIFGGNLPQLIQNISKQIGGDWMSADTINDEKAKFAAKHPEGSRSKHQVVFHQYLNGKPNTVHYSPDRKYIEQVDSLTAVLAPETRKALLERCIMALSSPEPFFDVKRITSD